MAGLPVVPGLAAEQSADRRDLGVEDGRDERRTARQLHLAEWIAADAVAAVDAEIEAGPRPDRDRRLDRHRQRGRRSTHRPHRPWKNLIVQADADDVIAY